MCANVIQILNNKYVNIDWYFINLIIKSLSNEVTDKL